MRNHRIITFIPKVSIRLKEGGWEFPITLIIKPEQIEKKPRKRPIIIEIRLFK